MPNGKWGIRSEKYNFEQRADGSASRNTITGFGGRVHGDGAAFGTHFIGTPIIYDFGYQSQ